MYSIYFRTVNNIEILVKVTFNVKEIRFHKQAAEMENIFTLFGNSNRDGHMVFSKGKDELYCVGISNVVLIVLFQLHYLAVSEKSRHAAEDKQMDKLQTLVGKRLTKF